MSKRVILLTLNVKKPFKTITTRSEHTYFVQLSQTYLFVSSPPVFIKDQQSQVNWSICDQHHPWSKNEYQEDPLSSAIASPGLGNCGIIVAPSTKGLAMGFFTPFSRIVIFLIHSYPLPYPNFDTSFFGATLLSASLSDDNCERSLLDVMATRIAS